MNIGSNALLKDVYVLKEEISQQQLSAAVNRCLCQIEALANIAVIADVATVELDTIHHFFWALSDMLQEARWLYRHLMNSLSE